MSIATTMKALSALNVTDLPSLVEGLLLSPTAMSSHEDEIAEFVVISAAAPSQSPKRQRGKSDDEEIGEISRPSKAEKKLTADEIADAIRRMQALTIAEAELNPKSEPQDDDCMGVDYAIPLNIVKAEPFELELPKPQVSLIFSNSSLSRVAH